MAVQRLQPCQLVAISAGMSETMTHAKGVFARGDGDALAPGVGALGEAAGAAGGFWRCGTGVRVGHGSGRGGVLGGRAAPVAQWVAPASPRSASLDTKPADTYISWPSGVAVAAGHASASAHAAWGERHSPGSGRSATSSARVGWSGWACASVDGWFMEHVAGAGAGGDVAQSTAGGAGDAELVAGLLFILHRRCCYRLPTSSPVNLIFK